MPEPPTGCNPIAPAELPSGGDAGQSVTVEASPRQIVSWGLGNDRVTQAVGWYGLGTNEEFPPSDGVATPIRGTEGHLQSTEELPNGTAAVSWEEGDCLYTVWLEPGYSTDEVVEYAARY